MFSYRYTSSVCKYKKDDNVVQDWPKIMLPTRVYITKYRSMLEFIFHRVV